MRQNPSNRLKSTREEKLAYLVEHRTEWFINATVDETAVTAVAEGMRANGMYGKSTPIRDVRFSIRELIYEILRREDFK